MTSLTEEVRNWVSTRDEILDLIFVSFEDELVNSIVDVLVTIENVGRVVLPGRYLETIRIESKAGSSPIERKYPDKIISTADYDKDPKPSLIFIDFNNDNRFTPKKIDYFETIDRGPRYRANTRSVILYRTTMIPPVNAFWMLSEIKGNIVFLELSEWGQLCQSIPKTPIVDNVLNTEGILSKPELSKAWLDSLRDHLSHILTGVIGTDEYNHILLSDENMSIWTRGFIHETFNYTTNYEGLEFFGDKICSTKFATYMYSKYPRMRANEYTEYLNQYLSRNHQWYLSDDLRLKDFVIADRSILTMTVKYKTDLFESFIGALFMTCQQVSISFAEMVTMNIFTLIGEQFPFEKKMVYGLEKHRVYQIFDSLGFPIGGNDLAFNFHEENKGLVNALNTFHFGYSAKFVQFLEMLAVEKKKDIRSILKYRFQYKPNFEERDPNEQSFFRHIAYVLESAGIDIRFAKSTKSSFFHTISFFDRDTYDKAVAKLAQIYPKEEISSLIKRVQFKSNKESDNNYVIMYIHTFEVEPNSILLNSLVLYTNPTQKASEDYLEESEALMQIQNLAVVNTPAVGATIGSHTLTTNDLACYMCIKKFIQF